MRELMVFDDILVVGGQDFKLRALTAYSMPYFRGNCTETNEWLGMALQSSGTPRFIITGSHLCALWVFHRVFK